MSFSSKVSLGLACLACIGTVGFVHYKQWSDKEKMHQGVIRDIERQRRRKIENIYVLQQQKELSKILKKQQDQDELIAYQLLEDSKKDVS